MVLFLSEEWAREYKNSLNSSDWTKSGKDWIYGPVALVVEKEEEKRAIILDINKGVCSDVKITNLEEAEKCPFVIYGTYERWVEVLRGELEPIKGLAQGKLRLKGDLPTIVRFVKAAEDMVKAAQKIPTEF